MKYEDFTQKYMSWTRAPRTAGEAFKTAEYATAVEVFTPTVKWRALLGEAVVWVAVWAVALVVGLAVFRGAA